MASYSDEMLYTITTLGISNVIIINIELISFPQQCSHHSTAISTSNREIKETVHPFNVHNKKLNITASFAQ